jgi:hypothetical protein
LAQVKEDVAFGIAQRGKAGSSKKKKEVRLFSTSIPDPTRGITDNLTLRLCRAEIRRRGRKKTLMATLP